MFSFFFFFSFRFPSETVWLIIEQRRVRAPVFCCAHWVGPRCGCREGVGGGAGRRCGCKEGVGVEVNGRRSVSRVSQIASLHQHFPSHLRTVIIKRPGNASPERIRLISFTSPSPMRFQCLNFSGYRDPCPQRQTAVLLCCSVTVSGN